ncbi:hypothetical protein evm_009102 [Chilo suppressalis]|nr:hypothetical protein evm_009102 [Chilo suppressalis]
MDIVLKLLICFKLVLLLPSASSSRCSIENHHGCTYTVSCVQRPSKIAVVPCAYEANVNVTFEIKQSQLDTLTSAFFSATNYDTRIKHIIAHENVWHTLETHTFKYFSRTISLNLTGNGIVNINNETFFQLEQLQYLYLSHNKIKILFQKSLSLATANALEELDLSYNMLTSLQSPLFTSLKNLHTLHLQNNQLISICDECFSGLKNLAILYLQNNNITSLNATFIPLNLSLLDLSSNKIKTLNHSEISHMNALLYLNISYNLLETVDTYAFENTWKMEYLDLSHNKIFSSIEPQMFMNNHLLKYIDLFDNEITTIRELAFQFNSIKYIELDQNSLSINISRNCLKGLKNIKYLNITKEKITAINEYAFVDMENLQFLNLSRNYIEYVDNTSFEFKYENKLTFLDLSYNFINDLYFLQNFTSRLIELYLNNNKLTILRTGIFEKHTMLIRLDVSENDIILLEPFSLPLVKLQYFNINKNNLMGNITKNVFSPAPFIRFLNLNNLKIQGIDENAFKDLQLLTKLNLSNNEIEFIHSNNFQNMEKMYSLDLSYNKLSQLEIAPNLISLSLGGNPIACEEIIRSVKLKESKKLEVTSIHKIFHDDNVHGIRCGNASYNSSAIESHNKVMDKSILEGEFFARARWSLLLTIWGLLKKKREEAFLQANKVRMVGVRQLSFRLDFAIT